MSGANSRRRMRPSGCYRPVISDAFNRSSTRNRRLMEADNQFS